LPLLHSYTQIYSFHFLTKKLACSSPVSCKAGQLPEHVERRPLSTELELTPPMTASYNKRKVHPQWSQRLSSSFWSEHSLLYLRLPKSATM